MCVFFICCCCCCCVQHWIIWLPGACSTAHRSNRLDHWDGLILDRSAVGQLSSLSNRTKWQRLPAGDTLRPIVHKLAGWVTRNPDYSTLHVSETIHTQGHLRSSAMSSFIKSPGPLHTWLLQTTLKSDMWTIQLCHRPMTLTTFKVTRFCLKIIAYFSCLW